LSDKNAEGEQLIREAITAAQAGDFVTAQKELDEVKALNDHQFNLWSAYGFLEVRRVHTEQAAEDFEKELSLHPNNYAVYAPLASTYTRLGKNDDAILVLRRWVAAEPTNPQATTVLVGGLLNAGDAAGAVSAAETGIAALPEDHRHDENIQIALGRAQERAGMKDKAGETFGTLLKSSENVGTLNTAAYELSQIEVQLDAAEAGARKALNKMSEESKTWTLDENLATLRGKSQLIAATWDTLGWILFLEKKPEAEGFVSAAWKNRQDGVVGEHLGEMLAMRGDMTEAIGVYKLALETISPVDSMGRKRDKPTAEQTKLQDKLMTAEAMAGKAAPAQGNGPKTLQEMRAVSLGSANGKSGVAEYKILLSSNGIERVEPTEDKTISGGETMIKKPL
jgi:tetratricopeptide (TPR) repeat protein